MKANKIQQAIIENAMRVGYQELNNLGYKDMDSLYNLAISKNCKCKYTWVGWLMFRYGRRIINTTMQWLNENGDKLYDSHLTTVIKRVTKKLEKEDQTHKEWIKKDINERVKLSVIT